MNKKLVLLSVLAIFAVTVTGTNMAFAATTAPDDELEQAASEAIAAVITTGGAGGALGAAYSVLRVGGKLVRGKKEPIVITQLLLTIVIGGIVGAVLGHTGLTEAEATGFSTIVVVFVTEIMKPIFAKRQWKKD